MLRVSALDDFNDGKSCFDHMIIKQYPFPDRRVVLLGRVWNRPSRHFAEMPEERLKLILGCFFGHDLSLVVGNSALKSGNSGLNPGNSAPQLCFFLDGSLVFKLGTLLFRPEFRAGIVIIVPLLTRYRYHSTTLTICQYPP